MLGLKYKVAVLATDEGFAVSVPGLPGCCSHGSTEGEALANIKVAIEECLASADDPVTGAEIREVEVAA